MKGQIRENALNFAGKITQDILQSEIWFTRIRMKYLCNKLFLGAIRVHYVDKVERNRW